MQGRAATFRRGLSPLVSYGRVCLSILFAVYLFFWWCEGLSPRMETINRLAIQSGILIIESKPLDEVEQFYRETGTGRGLFNGNPTHFYIQSGIWTPGPDVFLPIVTRGW